jgi:hypothetical protein
MMKCQPKAMSSLAVHGGVESLLSFSETNSCSVIMFSIAGSQMPWGPITLYLNPLIQY